MSTGIISIARPYAKAAFAYAKEQNDLASWSEQLALLSSLIEHAELRTILQNPGLSDAAQASLLIDIVHEKLSEPVKNFVRVLADNERLLALPAISELYDEYKAEAERVLDVELVSAKPIDNAEQNQLKTALQTKLAQAVNMTTNIDESLIGGVVVRAGDIVIDGSVKGRLQSLANQLA